MLQKLFFDIFLRGFLLYRTQEGFVDLNSARRSKVESKRSAASGQSEKEDRFGKEQANPRSQNLAERDIIQRNGTQRMGNAYFKRGYP